MNSSQAYTPTPYAMNTYGYVTINGGQAPSGTLIQAFDPRGTECGAWTVSSIGKYGIMPTYGDDPLTPEVEGILEGEELSFKINGYNATVEGDLIWANMEQNYINLSLSGIVIPPSGGGAPAGGGGGGGGGADKLTAFVSIMYQGQEAEFIFNTNKLDSLEKVGVVYQETVYSVEMEAKEFDKKPYASLEEPQDSVFNYILLRSERISENRLDNLFIDFKVSKEWIENNGLDVQEIELSRYVNDNLEPLEISHRSEDSQYVYYTAITSGLGYFAVTGKEGSKIPDIDPSLLSMMMANSQGSGAETPKTMLEENGEESLPVVTEPIVEINSQNLEQQTPPTYRMNMYLAGIILTGMIMGISKFLIGRFGLSF